MANQIRNPDECIKYLLDTYKKYEFYSLIKQIKQLIIKYPQIQLKFKSASELCFSSVVVHAMHCIKNSDTTVLLLELNVLGLLGIDRLLPDNYLELALQKSSLNDKVLVNFFDLFTQRMVELHYQAWQKTQDFLEQPILRKLLTSLSGNPWQCETNDSNPILSNVALYCKQPRSKSGLAQILKEHFGWPVIIYNYSATRQRLSISNRTQIAVHCTNYNRLGIDTWLGDHYWDTQRHFEIHIGPVNYSSLLHLLPPKSQLNLVQTIVKSYIGDELNAIIKIIIAQSEFPPCQLATQPTQAARLGWTALLGLGKQQNNTSFLSLNIKSLHD